MDYIMRWSTTPDAKPSHFRLSTSSSLARNPEVRRSGIYTYCTSGTKTTDKQVGRNFQVLLVTVV